MAEPVNAATVSAATEEDDADYLYADLDEQVAAALAAAGESGGSNGRDSDPAIDGEREVPDVDAGEAVDLGDCIADYSSSDEESDDGLRIVLNEDAGAQPSPPPPAARSEGYAAEDEDGKDSGNRVIGPSVNDRSRGKLGGFQCKGRLERTTVPIIGQGDGGRQHVFQKDFNFCLPRNSTIFDINIEAFQLKPWRQHNIDLTDYFNFGLDEQSWRKYWLSMKQARQGSRLIVNEESCKVESVKAANYSGYEGGNGLAKPKGRAIHVEDSVCERVPSADMRHPIQRDSDVVIQVNMMHSPLNQSISDESLTLSHSLVTPERISIDHHDDRQLKDSSIMVGRVVDKEVHNRGSSEYTDNKLYRSDSAHASDRSSSPGYSDTLSEESKEDLYYKRVNRHSDSRDFYEGTKLKDERVKPNLYFHSNESDHGNSKGDYLGRSCTPPVADKHQKAAKLQWRNESSFSRQGRSSDLLIDCKTGRRVPKSGYKARREQKRLPLAPGRCSVSIERDKSTDNYPRRCDMKYEQKLSSPTSRRSNYRNRNAVHGKLYGKQDYSHLKRVALRNDEHYLNDGSNDQHGRSSWRKFSEEDREGFSLAKEWWDHRDDRYTSMLEADISNGNDGQMYRKRHYQEIRRVRHGCNGDDEYLDYTEYRLKRPQSPDVRVRYSNRGMYVKSIDENLRHHNRHALYPQANPNSSQDWSAAGLTSMSSRNRCVGNKRILNANMVQYHYDGYHQKKKHHDYSFFADSIPQSALYNDVVAETGCCILPVKRKLHADLGSMNHKDIAYLSIPKGRRFNHDQPAVSDRKICAVKLHSPSKEFDAEGTIFSNDMAKSTASNFGAEARRELGKVDNIILNNRKVKFKRRGNQLIRKIENDSEGRLSMGDDLHGTKHKDVHPNMQGQNRGCGHSDSVHQDWEESVYQKGQNEYAEIEEGELIEQDEHDIVSKGKLSKQNKLALKSEINLISEDAVCKDGTTVECDEKHILEIMSKMQKRRERFKEVTTLQKGNNGEKKESLVVACSTEDIRNQRPVRKHLWSGGC